MKVSQHLHPIADFISISSITTRLAPWSIANSVSMKSQVLDAYTSSLLGDLTHSVNSHS